MASSTTAPYHGSGGYGGPSSQGQDASGRMQPQHLQQNPQTVRYHQQQASYHSQRSPVLSHHSLGSSTHADNYPSAYDQQQRLRSPLTSAQSYLPPVTGPANAGYYHHAPHPHPPPPPTQPQHSHRHSAASLPAASSSAPWSSYAQMTDVGPAMHNYHYQADPRSSTPHAPVLPQLSQSLYGRPSQTYQQDYDPYPAHSGHHRNLSAVAPSTMMSPPPPPSSSRQPPSISPQYSAPLPATKPLAPPTRHPPRTISAPVDVSASTLKFPAFVASLKNATSADDKLVFEGVVDVEDLEREMAKEGNTSTGNLKRQRRRRTGKRYGPNKSGEDPAARDAEEHGDGSKRRDEMPLERAYSVRDAIHDATGLLFIIKEQRKDAGRLYSHSFRYHCSQVCETKRNGQRRLRKRASEAAAAVDLDQSPAATWSPAADDELGKGKGKGKEESDESCHGRLTINLFSPVSPHEGSVGKLAKVSLRHDRPHSKLAESIDDDLAAAGLKESTFGSPFHGSVPTAATTTAQTAASTVASAADALDKYLSSNAAAAAAAAAALEPEKDPAAVYSTAAPPLPALSQVFPPGPPSPAPSPLISAAARSPVLPSVSALDPAEARTRESRLMESASLVTAFVHGRIVSGLDKDMADRIESAMQPLLHLVSQVDTSLYGKGLGRGNASLGMGVGLGVGMGTDGGPKVVGTVGGWAPTADGKRHPSAAGQSTASSKRAKVA